jgi:hypothetical protein
MGEYEKWSSEADRDLRQPVVFFDDRGKEVLYSCLL